MVDRPTRGWWLAGRRRANGAGPFTRCLVTIIIHHQGVRMPWNAAYWGNLLGLAAYVVGVLALVGGALLSGRLGARWAGRRWLFDTHQWVSWAVLVLGVVHGLLLWPRRGGATS